MSWTINMNWTFTDTNLGIKKNYNTIKTVTAIKIKVNTQINHLLPEDDLKCQKYMLKKNKLAAFVEGDPKVPF